MGQLGSGGLWRRYAVKRRSLAPFAAARVTPCCRELRTSNRKDDPMNDEEFNTIIDILAVEYGNHGFRQFVARLYHHDDTMARELFAIMEDHETD